MSKQNKDITVIINGGILRMDEAFYTGLGETYESLQDVANLGAFISTVGLFLSVGEEGLQDLKDEILASKPEGWEFDDGDDDKGNGELQ